MVHNIELRPGKGGQMVRSAGGAAQLMAKEGEHALLEAAVGRAAPGAHRVPRDDRPGRQPRPREHLRRQGGAHALAGPPLERARHRDEPGRPSARRRRGPLEGQPSAVAVGTAVAWLQDAAQQANQPVHRHAPQEVGAGAQRRGTFDKERSVHRRAPSQEGRGDERIAASARSSRPGRAARRSFPT